MTTPSEQQPREAGFFRAIRDWGLTRDDNGFLGGVVDGAAQRVGMATVPARIIVVVAAIVLNGLVLLAYGAAWGLLPDRRGNIIFQNFGRGVPNVGALIGIGVFTLLGMSGLDGSGPFGGSAKFSFSDPTPWTVMSIIAGILVPLAFVGGLVWFIIAMAKKSQNTPPSQPVAGATPQPAPANGAQQASDQPSATTPPATDSNQDDTTGPVYAAMPPRTASAQPPHSAPARPAAYQPVPPAPLPQPRVPGPGKGFYLTALAWIVLSGAIAITLEREDQLAVHPAAAWFVLMVTGLGVLLMAVSLAGRKLGFLGFMTIVLALPLPVIAAEADALRDTYAEDGGLLTFDIDFDRDLERIDAYDATAEFAQEYSEVILNGDCRQEPAVPADPSSTARLSFTSLEEDTSVDVVTHVTYVTIPEGTDLHLVGQGDAQAHVVWPDRQLTCDFWGAGGQHLTLANNVGPAVTMIVYDDEYANTIVITEVSS